MKAIDLRSDTVTRPCAAMRAAMANAEVGDDVYGEDPTVNALEAEGAALLGKEAALFVPSGTMANQIALWAQTTPGDEVLVAQDAHILVDETGAAAALVNVQLRPIGPTDACFSAHDVSVAIRPADFHYAQTRLVCVENTYNRAGGVIFPASEIDAIATVARNAGLHLHLDGARLCNAAVACGRSPAALAAPFDTVSLCLSKGLGAPVGSLLAGSKALIRRAWLRRKQLGGGMRQAGILAAAARYALLHNGARLEEDHQHARLIGERLQGAPQITFDLQRVQTNIVIFDFIAAAPIDAETFCERLKSDGVLLSAMGPRRVRAVTHLDVTKTECQSAADAILRALSAL